MGTCVHGYIEEYGCHIACFRIENLNRYSLLKKIQNGVEALARNLWLVLRLFKSHSWLSSSTEPRIPAGMSFLDEAKLYPTLHRYNLFSGLELTVWTGGSCEFIQENSYFCCCC